MMNLDTFFLENQHLSWVGSDNISLETPFLECGYIPELESILKQYYRGNTIKACSDAVSLARHFQDDACIYNLIACCFSRQQNFTVAKEFFDVSCKIIYSYHAVYHFIGYVLYYNRAALYHIMGQNDLKDQDLKHAQFLYHQNNPDRSNPIIISDENIHFKNPTTDMLQKSMTLSHLSIFRGSEIEISFWKSLHFFQKRQWVKCFDACTDLVNQISMIHKEYHYFAACIFFNRGYNALMLNRPDIAISDFSKAISFDEKNPRNTLYRTYLQKAQTMLIR